jgi:hypothetical protein
MYKPPSVYFATTGRPERFFSTNSEEVEALRLPLEDGVVEGLNKTGNTPNGFCSFLVKLQARACCLFAKPLFPNAPARQHLGSNNNPENGLVKPPRLDTRALSPVDMFGGKTPLRIAAQKRRPHAPLAPMRSAPAYFLGKWGV